MRDLIRRAELVSRESRRERFRNLRTLALTGTPSGVRAASNDIREWIGLSSSMLFARKNTQFGLVYPPYYGGKSEERWTTQDIEEMLELAREELHRLFYDGACQTVIASAVALAHYSDTAIVKMFLDRNDVTIDVLADYSDFCVLEEGRGLDRQEAMVHFYSMPMSSFWRVLHAVVPNEQERARLWSAAQDYQRDRGTTRGDTLPGALPRLMLASAAPNMVGNVVNTVDSMLAEAKSKEPVVDMAELWVWDDRAREICEKCQGEKMDYRHFIDPGGHRFASSDPPLYVGDWICATQMVATLDILWDVPNPTGLPGDHPFFPLSLSDPDILAGYCWGVAPVEFQIGLQAWSEDKLDDLNMRDKLDVNPPMSGYGVAMRDGEFTKGYRKPGADIPLTNPQAKVEFHRPPELADKFGFLDRIQMMKRRAQGIPQGMAGEAMPGQRSADQVVAQTMLGAGPTLNRAMVVEDWLNGLATAMMRMHRNVHDRFLVRKDGSRFLLRQMPGDFVANVWAHSASPIYTERLESKALAAHKDKLIDGRDALRFLGLPNTENLLKNYDKIEERQAEMGQKQMELAERTVKAKEEKAMK